MCQPPPEIQRRSAVSGGDCSARISSLCLMILHFNKWFGAFLPCLPSIITCFRLNVNTLKQIKL